MPFNRLREHDLGSRSVSLLDNESPGTFNYYRTESHKRCIYDETPVGKYRPGAFKISNVQMSTVEQNYPPCEMRWYTDSTSSKPSRIAHGNYCSGFQIEPDSNYLGLPPEDPLRTDNLLKRSFLSIKKDKFGLAETSAEFHQVVKMFASPIKGMVQILRKCYYDPHGLRRTLSSAANAWLQYRYGWYPLYKTVEAVSKGLPDFKGGIFTFPAFHVVQSDMDPVNELRPVFGPSWTMSVLNGGSRTLTTTYVVRHFVEVTDPKSFNAFKRGGSIYNVPQLVWELTPFSFVIDWFWSFSDYIAGLIPTLGANVLSDATYAVKHQEDIANWYSATGYRTLPFPIRAATRVTSTANRSTYRRLKVLPYSTSLPTLDFGFNNIKHVVDSLGLIFQQLNHLKN